MNNLNDFIGKIEFSKLVPNTAYLANEFAEQQRKQQKIIDEIVEHNAKKDAALFQTAEASIAQRELLENQLEQLKSQNKLLEDNYKKLEEMYNDQQESYTDAREDLKRSHKFNAWMMVVAIISMIAAIVSPIVTIVVSR